MTVVLDTNVVLQARAAGHVFQVILEELLAGRFALAVSTPILLEYEEIKVRIFDTECPNQYRQRFAYRSGQMLPHSLLRPLSCQLFTASRARVASFASSRHHGT